MIIEVEKAHIDGFKSSQILRNWDMDNSSRVTTSTEVRFKLHLNSSEQICFDQLACRNG